MGVSWIDNIRNYTCKYYLSKRNLLQKPIFFGRKSSRMEFEYFYIKPCFKRLRVYRGQITQVATVVDTSLANFNKEFKEMILMESVLEAKE